VRSLARGLQLQPCHRPERIDPARITRQLQLSAAAS
jgi:hypothetical protein